MRTRCGPAVVATVLALGIATPVLADTGVAPLEPLEPVPAPVEGFVDETTDRWFVEMASPPTADGTSLATTRAEKAAFRSAAKSAGLRYTERYAFDQLWNGLSITLHPSQLAALQRIGGVKAIYPVEEIPLPPTAPGDPDLYSALAMTGADIAQSELGYTGNGVKVAVMDTGIDYDHRDLGDGFGLGHRVAYGHDFVGDAYNADETSPSYNPVPVPDPYPDDCNGHGTHVAGIVGANGTVKGVAPDVTFGAYRVFGCQGSTESDIMIAAMERALADGMQVLNMSIGSAYQWPQYPTAMAASRLVNKGMVVVASIGNNGANGLYAAGAPGLGDKVIGVASVDNTYVSLTTFTVSPDSRAIGYAPATGAPRPPTSGVVAMARTGTTTTTDDACSPLPAGSLTGTVALVRRGGCTFYTKASNAEAARAVGVVLYNNAAGRFSPTVAGDPPITIPVVAISQAEGALIDARLAAGPVDLTWTDQTGSFADPNGGLVSSFSSYGLSPDLALKPDVAAPGGNIYSTYPLEKGGYATLGGTSMAAPHVAGAAALLLQAHPRTPAQAMRGILQSSADPIVWWGNPGLGFLDNVHRQGAGLLDIDDAILATTTVKPATLALGESELGPATRTLTIENHSTMPVTYVLTSVNALSTGGVMMPSFFTSNAVVTYSVPSVAVPAHGKAWVDVTITPASGPEHGQYGGYLVLTPQGGGPVYRVPFAGFVGDYQAIPALTSGGYEFPWLAWLDGGGYYQLSDPSDWTYTMVGTDLPYLLVHLDHQVEQMKVEVFHAVTHKSWHLMYRESHLPRNSTATSFFAFPFDGTTTAGKKTYTVPDGSYSLRLSVLKALGDPANPMHWETWTSPTFVIDRP